MTESGERWCWIVSVVTCMNMMYGAGWDCVGNNNYKEVTPGLRQLRHRELIIYINNISEGQQTDGLNPSYNAPGCFKPNSCHPTILIHSHIKEGSRF